MIHDSVMPFSNKNDGNNQKLLLHHIFLLLTDFILYDYFTLHILLGYGIKQPENSRSSTCYSGTLHSGVKNLSKKIEIFSVTRIVTSIDHLSN